MALDHYIIFHPDNQRDQPLINATALSNRNPLENWQGRVHVDKIEFSNEDPFVFNDPWIYSYCHASQLRRSRSSKDHVDVGSWLFFVSGQEADKGRLSFDTVFLVEHLQPWLSPSSLDPQLPAKYEYLRRQQNDPLYLRHFCAPFDYINPNTGNPAHGSVSFTYEANMWELGKNEYSFLPLTSNHQKVVVLFSELEEVLRNKIIGKTKGKIPADLSTTEQSQILSLVSQRAKIQVVKSITLLRR